MNIAIVTDSTADIPKDLLETYQISVVPNLVILDGQSLEDEKDISRQEFYKRLPHMDPPPTTATASSGSYLRLFEKLFDLGASGIVSIHAASQLSGIFNAASTAAQIFGGLVQVIDSGQVSLGLGFQTLAAAEASANGATLERILEIVEDVRRRVRLIAMLDTLEYVRRSGRVSWARAHLSNMFQIKPFIELKDGQVRRLGEARTRKKGVERLLRFLRELGKLERLAILHTNAEDDAREILAELNPDLLTNPLVVNVTTVIGVHVGPNGVGFAAVVR